MDLSTMMEYVQRVPKRIRAVMNGTIEQRRMAVDAFALDVDAQVGFSCRAGCSHCCRGVIAASQEEAEQIFEAMPQPALERLRANPAFMLSMHDETCPLLDEGTGRCTVYRIRPLTCRTWHVVSPPENCSKDRPDAQVGQIGELIASATFLYVADGLRGDEGLDPTKNLTERLIELDRERSSRQQGGE